jgi:cardiolipin synthase
MKNNLSKRPSPQKPLTVQRSTKVINLPNILSLLRILMVPLFVIFLIREMYAAALFIFVFAGLTDGLDGFLARYFNQHTVLGAFLDPAADKLLLTAAFITLAFQQTVPAWLTVVVFSRDVLIILGLATLRFTHTAFEIQPTMLSKVNTAVQLLTIFLVLLEFQLSGPIPFRESMFWLTGTLTILSGLHYIYLGLAIMQAESGKQEDG